MKLLDIALLRGLKRKLGKFIEAVGALGIVLPGIGVSDLPIPTDANALKLFAVGLLLKLLGEVDAKLRGDSTKP